ncbi:Ldh family oxidoreductase [Fodinicurvata sp. EGI_FJ10296]|uniref:Ldh family oxidoreductase n=1 Tax=Fodinicurvata sp. EGI_FJ10296 TaxID=3231908 RepID=UPI0034553FE3
MADSPTGVQAQSDAGSGYPRVAGYLLAADAERFLRACLKTVGADDRSVDDASRSLVGASLRGTDSHGVRLLPHYCKALRGGRVQGAPKMTFHRTAVAGGLLDAGHGLGHTATYRAVDHAVGIAEDNGIGAVGVTNSSHFGAAGSYALAAAEAGMIGLVICNSDAFVLPHNGTKAFHGTNPIAFAAPVPDARPFLLDMATSTVPWNRIQQFAASGRSLPPGAAVDAEANETLDPKAAAGLLPLGGLAFGHKGSGLAAMIDVMCALMTGMPHSARLLPMGGPDMATPRQVSHSVMVMRRDMFIAADDFDAAMTAYRRDMNAVPAADAGTVLMPGQKEWLAFDERSRSGIPFTGDQVAVFEALAAELAVQAPAFSST